MAAPDFGPKPIYRELPVDCLHADPRYQRDMRSSRSKALVGKIGANFRWERFGVVQVTPWREKDGPQGPGYAILDGQHRAAGAKVAGVPFVPCLVYDGLTPEQAAAVFVDVNRDRVSVTAMALYHGQVAAGDPEAVPIAEMCAAAGIEIARYPIPAINMKPGQTMAVGAIRRCVKDFGTEATGRALALLAEAFSDQAGRLRADLIRGLCLLQRRLGGLTDAQRAQLVGWLRDTPPNKLQERANDECLASGNTGYDAHHTVLAVALGLERPASQRQAGVADPHATLTQPVNKRCAGCNQLFRTRLVHKTRCDACVTKARGGASQGNAGQVAP